MLGAMRFHRRQDGQGGVGPWVFVIVVGLLLLAANPVRAEIWYENYSKAEQAIQDEDWAEAVDLLEQAMAQKGESGARVRTIGMRFIPYFPYLKLGIARFNLEEYDAALLAFEAEERLGAIQSAVAEFAELQDYQRRAQNAKAAAELGQREQVVAGILADAATLENQDELDAAITTLSRAEAMDSSNPDVLAALTRVRTKIAQRDEQDQLVERADNLVAQGRTHLSTGDYGEAAAVFARANSLRSSSEIQALLNDAQSKLGAELEAQQDAARRRTTITDGIERARQLEQGRDFVGALDALQVVLALDPGNVEAGLLQQSLLGDQADAESAASLQDRVQAMLQKAVAQFEAGDLDESLVTANHAYAIDPRNGEVFRHINSIYREFDRQHLSPEELAKIPSFIRIVPDLRDFLLEEPRNGRWPATENGRRVELVTSPEFRFGGVVSTAATRGQLRVYDQREELLHEAEWTRRPTGGNEDNDGNFFRTRFGLRYVLTAGLTVFRIEASNQGGMSVTREYAVLYEPPFPWLVAIAAVVAAMSAAGAGVYFGRRLHRRRQLFKRRFNPYIAGAPVLKDDLFFGRERLLSRVLQTVHNNSILLYGERRIGKTSFQHHLSRRLKQLKDPDYNFYPVFTDLQGTPEDKFFSTLAEDVFEQLGPQLDGLESDPALHDDTAYEYKQFVRDIRNVLRTLNSKSEKKIKVVLLIDEVDELNDYDPRINQKLRALFMRSFAEDLVAVVSGVGIKKQWESEGSPWYNFFEEIRVEPFRKEDADELIKRPIEGLLTLEPGAVDRIITLADCKPYPIQKLCVALVNRMYNEKRRHITVADVDAVSQSREA